VTPQDHAAANQLLRRLVGRHLTQLCVGVGDVRLRFNDEHCGVSLEGHITVGPPGSAVPVITPEGVALLMPLLNGELTDARIDERGTLALTIGEVTVRAVADGDYESWYINGPDDIRVVCLPGGDLAIWGPRTDA
jgi:hypothetical protein